MKTSGDVALHCHTGSIYRELVRSRDHYSICYSGLPEGERMVVEELSPHIAGIAAGRPGTGDVAGGAHLPL
jgi:hypothetical protein